MPVEFIVDNIIMIREKALANSNGIMASFIWENGKMENDMEMVSGRINSVIASMGNGEMAKDRDMVNISLEVWFVIILDQKYKG